MADVPSVAEVRAYREKGFVVLRGVFKAWIPALRRGADRNDADPSESALIHHEGGHEGRFLEDFCNWQRIPEYEEFVYNSPMGPLAAALMESRTAQFFHDHYLHKEADTGVATPWHQDLPYYCVQGEQTVSFWIPLDPREESVSLRCVVGSHRLSREIRPTSWSTQESFYEDDAAFMDMPDIEGGDYETESWAMELGDTVAFNFKTIHGATPNVGPARSRTLSFRVLGDDVRFL
ncbi:MAG: phytanoyl-CoA dioxygenase family protein, partial [Thermoplasmata archaeon]|nr:phytanoyl-CoA dioxygenase family protein [Thermoplasmata archaeon]